MDIIPTPEARAALIARVKNILLQPKLEWPVIAAEPATVGGIYSSYVVYVAAVPVLATLIGSLVFGYGIGNITFRPSIGSALTTAVLQYAVQLGGVYIFALIIDALAPRFGGRADRISAFKLAAYSATASWLAGAFGLIPALGILSILGLYSLYLLYTGVPVLMKVPQERAFAYTATLIGVAIVLSIIAAALSTCFLTDRGAIGQGEAIGKLSLPGGVTVDMDKLEQATKHMEQMAKQMEQGMPGAGASSESEPASGEDVASLPAISPDNLKALLPASLPGGFARGEASSSSGGAAGFTFGTAKADYSKGTAHIALSLMDMGAMGAFAALGSAIGANASEETETSYSKIGQVGGRMTVEEFNRATNSGKYGVIVSDRVMVEASGQGGPSMDDLKSAVGAVDIPSIEALASK